MLRKLGRFIRTRGAAHLFREATWRTVNAACEFAFNVETSGAVTLHDVGTEHDGWHGYGTAGYWATYSGLRAIPIPKRDISLVDLGSGKGRPVIVAAAMGIRAIGVDVVPQFNEIARRNVLRMRGRRSTPDILEHDATLYRIPDHVNVIFIGNSFSGEVLRDVIENIRTTYCRSPRPLYILYFNTRIFDEAVAGLPWIRKIRGASFYPEHNFCLYEVGPK